MIMLTTYDDDDDDNDDDDVGGDGGNKNQLSGEKNTVFLISNFSSVQLFGLFCLKDPSTMS